MQLVCKHKIGLHSATASRSYPVIRLPREFAALAGEPAHVYQTEQDGKLTFVIEVGTLVGTTCAQDGRSQIEERLSALEKDMSGLKESLYPKGTISSNEKENQWARCDSNA